MQPVQEKKKEKPVEQKQVARKPAASVSTAKPKAAKPQESSVPRPHGNGNVNPAKEPPIIDLLGMDNPVPQAGAPQQVVTQDNDNEFDLFMRAAPVNTAQQNQVKCFSLLISLDRLLSFRTRNEVALISQ